LPQSFRDVDVVRPNLSLNADSTGGLSPASGRRLASFVRPLVTNGVALSQDSSYYVYALKDSRTSPALTFYVGKGVGTRSHDHLLKPDATRKGARIKEIVASGGQVLVSRLVDAITESQAIKLEAELHFRARYG